MVLHTFILFGDVEMFGQVNVRSNSSMILLVKFLPYPYGKSTSSAEAMMMGPWTWAHHVGLVTITDW